MRNLSGDKSLKEVLAEKIPQEQEIVKAFRKSHGSTKVGEVTVDMVSSLFAKNKSNVSEIFMITAFINLCANKFNLIIAGRHTSITYHLHM